MSEGICVWPRSGADVISSRRKARTLPTLPAGPERKPPRAWNFLTTTTKPPDLRNPTPPKPGQIHDYTVRDTFSRRVVGWSVESTQTTVLVLNALWITAGCRRAPGLRRSPRLTWSDGCSRATGPMSCGSRTSPSTRPARGRCIAASTALCPTTMSRPNVSWP